jgi:uncharacterized protein
MADHPNAELFRRGYTAFQQGDMDAIRALFDADIVWHQPGHHHLSGDYRGIDAVLDEFGKTFQETNGTYKVEIHDILANDTHAVALASNSGERDGKHLSDRYTHVAHIEGGRLKESWIFSENQDKVDEFWG